MKVSGVINDLHIPFHDPKAVALALDIIEDYRCQNIYLNGDVMDFYNVNMHGPSHPMVGTLLEDEISRTRIWLQELRKRFKKQRIIYLFGNHEDRLERYILKNARALYGVIKLDKLLMLEELGIDWTPYNDAVLIDGSDVWVQHSPPSYAKAGAMTSLERDVDRTTIYGCTHREQKATRTGKSGKEYYCYFNGWLGSTKLSNEHKKVFSYVKGHESWQQCLSIVTAHAGIGYVEQISIKGGKAACGGYLYG